MTEDQPNKSRWTDWLSREGRARIRRSKQDQIAPIQVIPEVSVAEPSDQAQVVPETHVVESSAPVQVENIYFTRDFDLSTFNDRGYEKPSLMPVKENDPDSVTAFYAENNAGVDITELQLGGEKFTAERVAYTKWGYGKMVDGAGQVGIYKLQSNTRAPLWATIVDFDKRNSWGISIANLSTSRWGLQAQLEIDQRSPQALPAYLALIRQP